MSEPFPSTALRRRHAQTVRDSSFSNKIDYVIVIKTFLNPEGHQNLISCSKVMAILLKGLILPICRVASGIKNMLILNYRKHKIFPIFQAEEDIC